MNKFPGFHHHDTEYSLRHLDSFYHEFIQTTKNNEQTEKRYKCLIEFSNHCFTKGVNIRKGEKLTDFSRDSIFDDGKEQRIFCETRYRLSLRFTFYLERDG